MTAGRAPMLTTVVEEQRGDVTVLTVIGSLDAEFEQEMLALCARLVAAGRFHLVLDVTQMGLLDSSGVGTLVSLSKKVRSNKGDLNIVGMSGQPLEIFKLLRLHRVFEIQPSVEIAVARLREIIAGGGAA